MTLPDYWTYELNERSNNASGSLSVGCEEVEAAKFLDHEEITQSHIFAALIRLSTTTTTHNVLTFNINEISWNNSDKLSLLANKHLWTFLSHSSYASSRM